MSDFTYDVFLSYHWADRAIAHRIAEALRSNGLRVWFDAWIIKPGDDIFLAIERGLEEARVQVVCLSPSALGSDWINLERAIVPFRDLKRRLVPVLLADCELPDSLRLVKCIDFRRNTEAALNELLDACRVSVPQTPMDSMEIYQYVTAKVVLVGDTGVGKTGLSLVLNNHPFEANGLHIRATRLDLRFTAR